LSGSVTAAAHSLGNMVLGQAIQQYGLRPDNYFMLNPAVPTEAYNGTQLAGNGLITGQNLMALPDWYDYYDAIRTNNPRRLWASDWYQLFTGTDKRQQLTWRDLFKNVPNSTVYNFYSTGEEVLAHTDGSEYTSWDTIWNDNGGIGANAWVIQEHQKGKLTLASGLSGAEAGWGFNCREDKWKWVPNFACFDNSGLNRAEAFALSDAQLRLRPFAKPFSQDDLFNDDIDIANNTVDIYKDHTLAFGVPALSHATGSTELDVGNIIKVNFDMNTQLKTGWPSERGSEPIDIGWRHNDVKNVAYRYVHGLYDTWVEKGNLNK
jgi:hypothetical protein